MLHLQARIHLQEVEVLLLIDEELDRSGICVSGGLGDANRDLTHPAAHVGIDDGRRRFLDDFLMAALDRALALAQIHRVAVLVGKHLHLDVARIDDRFLDIDFAVAERTFRLAARALQRGLEFLRADARGAFPFRRLRPQPSA